MQTDILSVSSRFPNSVDNKTNKKHEKEHKTRFRKDNESGWRTLAINNSSSGIPHFFLLIIMVKEYDTRVFYDDMGS